MGFELRVDEPVGKELARRAKKVLSNAMAADHEESASEAVHIARKGIKKTRAILSLVENDVRRTRRIDKRLRRVGRRLSEARDVRAVVETFERATKRAPRSARPAVARVAGALQADVEHFDRVPTEQRLVGQVRHKLRAAKRKLQRVEFDRIDDADVRRGITRAYRRGQRALARARASNASDDFHRWRKRAKTLWYHLRLIASRADVHAAIEALARLEEWLGEDHNVAVLRDRLNRRRSLRSSVWLIEPAFDQYQAALRQQALTLGERFYADTPNAFERRLSVRTVTSRHHQRAA